MDLIFASFVRKRQDVLDIRAVLHAEGGVDLRRKRV